MGFLFHHTLHAVKILWIRFVYHSVAIWKHILYIGSQESIVILALLITLRRFADLFVIHVFVTFRTTTNDVHRYQTNGPAIPRKVTKSAKINILFWRAMYTI